jgi:hypothetical protein
MIKYSKGTQNEEDSQETSKSKGKINETFLRFLNEVGNEKVSNPNPKSRDRFPKIKVKSLSASPEGQREIKRLFEKWRSTEYGKVDKSKIPTKKPPSKSKKSYAMGVTQKDIEAYKAEHKEVLTEVVDSIKASLGKSGENPHKKLATDIKNLYMKSYRDEIKVSRGGTIYTEATVDREIASYTKDDILTRTFVQHHAARGFEKIAESKNINKTFKDYFTESWLYNVTETKGYQMHGVLSGLGVKGSIPEVSNKGIKITTDEVGAYTSGKDKSLENYDEVHGMLKETYLYTQSIFDMLDIKELTMYRGIKEQIGDEPPDHGDAVQVECRPLSSWTTDPRVAYHFGDRARGNRVIKTTVPVSQILGGFINHYDFSTNGVTGQGRGLDEEELMVLNASSLESIIIDPETEELQKKSASKKEPLKIQLTGTNEDWLASLRREKRDKKKEKKKKSASSTLTIAHSVAQRVLRDHQ